MTILLEPRLILTRGHQTTEIVWKDASRPGMIHAMFCYLVLTTMQMGMSTQLLFTIIVALMKVAILLTYLRKRC